VVGGVVGVAGVAGVVGVRRLLNADTVV
jgi:hypothetical protein